MQTLTHLQNSYGEEIQITKCIQFYAFFAWSA